MICICKSGEIILATNGKVNRIKTGNLFILLPYQHFKIEKMSEEVSLQCVYFPEKYVPCNSLELLGVDNMGYCKTYYIDEASKNDVDSLFDMISRYCKKEDLNSFKAVQALGESVIRIALNSASVGNDNIESVSRSELLVQSFLKLVEEHFLEYSSLQRYSELLSVTPKHLTTTVKKVTGISAHEWISRFILHKAKHLLITTEMSASQISYTLNFSTPCAFNRFFKRMTGCTPDLYRKMN